MTRHSSHSAIAAALLTAAMVLPFTSRAHASAPETVMVTLHAKPGSEAALARVLERHWDTARRLKLVADATHVTLRGVEAGDKTYFVELFTWLDADIPDHAPQPILAIWKEMNDLVEPRNGQPGLHFTEVSLLSTGDGQRP